MAEFTPETLKKIEENQLSTQIIEFLAWKYKLDVNDWDGIIARAEKDVAAL